MQNRLLLSRIASAGLVLTKGLGLRLLAAGSSRMADPSFPSKSSLPLDIESTSRAHKCFTNERFGILDSPRADRYPKKCFPHPEEILKIRPGDGSVTTPGRSHPSSLSRTSRHRAGRERAACFGMPSASTILSRPTPCAFTPSAYANMKEWHRQQLGLARTEIHLRASLQGGAWKARNTFRSRLVFYIAGAHPVAIRPEPVSWNQSE